MSCDTIHEKMDFDFKRNFHVLCHAQVHHVTRNVKKTVNHDIITENFRALSRVMNNSHTSMPHPVGAPCRIDSCFHTRFGKPYGGGEQRLRSFRYLRNLTSSLLPAWWPMATANCKYHRRCPDRFSRNYAGYSRHGLSRLAECYFGRPA